MLLPTRWTPHDLNAIWSIALLLTCAAMGSGQEVRDRELDDVRTNSQSAVVEPRYLPPGTQPPNAFKLGVMARNTQTGVSLTQVLGNSVAQRAGLESGDTIVTVNGYQVGYVAGRLYDLGDELARRVDSQGRVNLLVRNHRDGQLVNVPLRFTPALRTVTGAVQSRTPVLAGRGAVLMVRLLDVTRPHWRDVTIAEVSLPMPVRWPANYRLDVDPANIHPGHRYAVDARVTERGQIVSQTAAPLPVALSESGSRADLTLTSPGNRPGVGAIPYDLIVRWYEQYLKRRPTAQELNAWQADLARGKSLDDVQAGILSSSEFFDQQQNDRDRYVDEVYRQLNGITPTPEQHRTLREELERQGDVRQRFARELLRSREQSPGAGENP